MSTTIVACGGDDGGGGTLDAKMADAKVFMDAPPVQGVMGLGQKCDMSNPCPTGMDCIGLALGGSSSPTYCTPHCLDNGTATTNAMAQFTAQSFSPAPTPANCTNAYMGSVGTAVCGVLLAYTPMDNPLVANKQYTMIDLGCAVQCGSGSTCPMGMTCTMNFCFPN